MKKRFLLVISVIVFVGLVIYIWAARFYTSSITEEQPKVFSSQEECQAETGYFCDVQLCDYRCPPGFKKGWIATTRKYRPTPIEWTEAECKVLEEDIEEMLGLANHCKKDSDCMKINLGCPFGCYNLVNITANTNDIGVVFSEFETNCNKCYYDCDRDPTPSEIKCINNSCIDTRYNSLETSS